MGKNRFHCKLVLVLRQIIVIPQQWSTSQFYQLMLSPSGKMVLPGLIDQTGDESGLGLSIHRQDVVPGETSVLMHEQWRVRSFLIRPGPVRYTGK